MCSSCKSVSELPWGFEDLGDGLSLRLGIRTGFLDAGVVENGVKCLELSPALQPFLDKITEEWEPMQRWALPNVYGTDRFRCEVGACCDCQEPEEQDIATILIFDEKHTLEICTALGEAAFQALRNLLVKLPWIPQDQEDYEAKTFMWAKRTSEHSLLLYLDDRQDVGTAG
ncbi:hypothetical protein WJX73_005086 [Symbiochloris irregularis]|uniref:Uncharacterized protein n=1 Tax=Symbiochloris irregularis TaxID=706552 RepID=A0AAW1PTE3_9CHLO